MDKNVLKKFAIESRQELMEKIANKINRYYVDEEFNVNQNGEVYILFNDKHTLRLTKNEYENRQLLVKRIKEITLEQVIEEAAYTWFNRIIAIRYMEIHDYLPLTRDNQSLGVRVLSSKDNTPDPEIMKISNLINPDLDIEFNKEYYRTIQDNNKRFEYIILLVCKKLGKVIPQVFDGITDYIDILIPDNLLNESGYIVKLLSDISEDNFDNVEIIGWLYQYYNQTEKDRVMSNKKAYSKNEIPFATQLFTPDWIVKYMVENSLGKYWIKNSGKKELINNWKFYINDENESDIAVKNIDPKNIKCIDPCSGSGHILIYMFEVLFQIYESYGYSKTDIAENILKYNIFGLDIDDRAGQLSILSVILKARDYDKNIFSKDVLKNLNVLSFDETCNINKNVLEILEDKKELNEIFDMFKNAKDIGSLLILKKINYEKILNDINELNESDINMYDYDKLLVINNVISKIAKITQILTTEYDVVVTNPPYMGDNGMNNNLKSYLKNNYNDFKSDLFACFIKKCVDITKQDGYTSMITMQSWMFLSSYEKLREYILKYNINSLIHIGFNSFPELNSKVALGVAFTINKNKTEMFKGQYFDLNQNYSKTYDKEQAFFETLHNNKKYILNSDSFLTLPGKQISFWTSNEMFNDFKNGENINKYIDSFQGIITGNNDKFLRLWYEVKFENIYLDIKKINKLDLDNKYWIPYNKGGDAIKWYGNQDYIINWKNGPDDKTRGKKTYKDYYFREYVSWAYISLALSMRYYPKGFLWDVHGSGMFSKNYDNNKDMLYLLGLGNSIVGNEILKILNSTISYQVENILQIPVIIKNKERVVEIVKECIEIMRLEFDKKETSWNFKLNEIIAENNSLISKSVENIIEKNKNDREKLKKNEEELNRVFLDTYNLSNQYSPNIDEKSLSLKVKKRENLIKELIIYSVGCMFGRYSLDESGLILAGEDINYSDYRKYVPDKDNIIPITDEVYFNDDIATLFTKFIEKCFGKENLNNNLTYIAETLGKKDMESNEETIRRYFINDFYNDYCNMYSVTGSGYRPIYWMFDSGKKNGFKCLIYMHRYNEGIVSKIRLDYLHKIQNSYEKKLKEMADKLNNDIDLTSKRELAKKQADISAKLQETNEYDEKIAHIADQKIKIDLDDGVVVNYAKFSVKNPKTGKDESILAKIK